MTTTIITGSQTVASPGVYAVTTANITITLGSWAHWGDASKTITIKDMTGLSAPNILVTSAIGAIDGSASILINQQNESLTFQPYTNGVNWVIQ